MRKYRYAREGYKPPSHPDVRIEIEHKLTEEERAERRMKNKRAKSRRTKRGNTKHGRKGVR